MKNFLTYLVIAYCYTLNSLFAQSSINPYQTIQAEDFNDQSGIKLSNGGTAVGYIQDGDYIGFTNLDFGNEGGTSITVRASSNTSGGTIEYRLDSPTGDLVGTLDIPNTGGWASFESFTVNNTTGFIYNTEDVYLVFRGGSGYLLDVDEFVFSTEVIATSISINNCITQIELGATYDFDVTITPANTTNQTVAFTTTGGTDIDYLSGEYTASSLGTKTVYVTSFSDGSVSDQCTFEVVAPVSITTDPYQTIQAEDFNDQSGIKLSNEGAAVGYIQDGDYIGFTNLDFGNEGGTSITVRASSNTSGGTIEYRLDSPTGDLVGTLDIPNTGGWASFESFTVNNTTGFIYNTEDVYLVFRGESGYLLDVDEFVFSTEVIATSISINNCITQIELGATYDFDVTITPANTTNQTVAFTTTGGTDIDYLSGEYTASSLGTKTVYVTSFSDGSVSDQCTFEVVAPVSITTDPYQTIQAEDFNDQSGIKLSNEGAAVGYIQDGDYIGFSNLDFGNEGGKSITILASSNTSGGTIEYRLDSPTGDLVGTVEVPNTGGWRSFESFTVNNTAGFIYNTEDVYLVFRGGNGFLLDVDELVFSTEIFATSISITNCPTQIELGTTYDFDAEIFPSNTTDQFFQFTTSSGSGINTISGEYTATSLGTQTVTVTSFSEASNEGFVSDQCTFEVVESLSARTGSSSKSKPTDDKSSFTEGSFDRSSFSDSFLSVYPNPGNGLFTIKTAPETRITVTDIAGRVVVPESVPSDAIVDLTSYPKGVYLLRTSEGKTARLIRK